jgi:hypothetical protein
VVLALALFSCYATERFVVRARTDLFTFGDLRAFYCSAHVALSYEDPYLAEPLGACERATIALRRTDFVLPAPIPPFAIAFLEPASRLDFETFSRIWCIALTLNFFFICGALSKVTEIPYVLVALTLLPLGLMLPLELGQLVPLCLGLLLCATVLVGHGRDRLAALFAAAAMFEPQIALPVCVALCIARSRSRIVFAGAAILAFAIAEWTVGSQAMMEYGLRVIPEHVVSEARLDGQYSLTYILGWLHVPINLSIALGKVSYVFFATVGITGGVGLFAKNHDARDLVFLPLALSVVFGPYVHLEHLLAALPLALLLVSRASRRWQFMAIITIILVAWPAKFLAILSGVPGGAAPINIGVLGLSPLSLADSVWQARVEPNSAHLPYLLMNVPTWIGLLGIVFGTIALLAQAPLLPAFRSANRR